MAAVRTMHLLWLPCVPRTYYGSRAYHGPTMAAVRTMDVTAAQAVAAERGAADASKRLAVAMLRYLREVPADLGPGLGFLRG